MARLKIVSKSLFGHTLSLKENIHISRSKRYKRIIMLLSIISIVEFFIIGAKHVNF